ncbi:hypothetical protein [Streptomyces sp. NBC_00388]|uniref:hypothetical protein n=1 Tax=Streptomyces sp. NBC_00388 TaxID=2975735 RepID=UPI002E1A2CAD
MFGIVVAGTALALLGNRGFGPEGEGSVRLDFGTSPALLKEITRRMSEALG